MSARSDLADLIASRLPATTVYAYPVDPDRVEAGGAVVVQPTTITVTSINARTADHAFDVVLLVPGGDDPEQAEDALDELVGRFLAGVRPATGTPGLTIGTLTRGTYQDAHHAYSTPVTLPYSTE